MRVDPAVHVACLDDGAGHPRGPTKAVHLATVAAPEGARAPPGLLDAADPRCAAAHALRPRGRIRARDGHRQVPHTRIEGALPATAPG
ncbi:hypothetical protein STRIP9103_08373 [Streptomyces ipomoeae 91-03]|uniref:Uncharacterized protein n=1 Tax=Streptomyces ipomoeae 91-03 TaxID=698759 RepID=L1KUZ1_9ACTN|nr:hypothetical protein STRIP9103_08373 [Streptomyces ipomoeae 91-03]